MGVTARRIIGRWLDGLLRGRDEFGVRLEPPETRVLIGVILFCGCSYGAVMGSFSGRPLQMFYSASKVPLLFGVTFVVAMPAFFVLNTLAGLRADFADVLRALTATQAGLTVILLSLAPLTLFWYVSCPDYSSAVVFNTLMFGAASVTGQVLLFRFYRGLIRRNPLHGTMLKVWLVIFSFVGVQTGWMLRPFIGSPERPAEFVRTGEWSNAYVAVFRLFCKVVFGE